MARRPDFVDEAPGGLFEILARRCHREALGERRVTATECDEDNTVDARLEEEEHRVRQPAHAAIEQRDGRSERMWKIGEAIPAVREALDKELIGVGVAFELSRLPPIPQQEYCINTVQTFHMTVAETKKLVDETLEFLAEPKPEPVKVQPIVPVKPTCEVCHDEAPHNLLVGVMLDPKCYGKLDVLVMQERARAAAAEVASANTPSP